MNKIDYLDRFVEEKTLYKIIDNISSEFSFKADKKSWNNITKYTLNSKNRRDNFLYILEEIRAIFLENLTMTKIHVGLKLVCVSLNDLWEKNDLHLYLDLKEVEELQSFHDKIDEYFIEAEYGKEKLLYLFMQSQLLYGFLEKKTYYLEVRDLKHFVFVKSFGRISMIFSLLREEGEPNISWFEASSLTDEEIKKFVELKYGHLNPVINAEASNEQTYRLFNLAMQEFYSGDFKSAEKLFQEAVQLAKEPIAKGNGYKMLAGITLQEPFEKLVTTALPKLEKYVGRAEYFFEKKISDFSFLLNLYKGNYEEAFVFLDEINEKDMIDDLETAIIKFLNGLLVIPTTNIKLTERFRGNEGMKLKLYKLIFQKYKHSFGILIRIAEHSAEIQNKGELFAYEVASYAKKIDSEDFLAYSVLTKICSSNYLNRPKELIIYAEKGIELVKKLMENEPLNQETLNKELGVFNVNLSNAYISMDKFEDALSIITENLKVNPSVVDLMNAGKILLKLNRYDEAIEMFYLSTLISPNKTTYKYLGDLYKIQGKLEESQKNYELALKYFHMSYLREEMLEKLILDEKILMIESYIIPLLEVYLSLNELIKGKMLLDQYKEDFSDSTSYNFWNNLYSKELNLIVEGKELKKQLKKTQNNHNKEIEKLKKQLKYQRDWMLDLLKSQSFGFDGDIVDTDFESAIEGIVIKMMQQRSMTTSYENHKKKLKKYRGTLTLKSIDFLATANYLLESNEQQSIDFAPIVVEYSKVIEEELRGYLQSNLTLGKLNYQIKNKKIAPFNKFTTILDEITLARNNCAHPGVTTYEVAIRIKGCVMEFIDLISNLPRVEKG